MAEPIAYSLWLVPAHPLREMLARIVSELAQRFETAAFTPHATLCSGNWHDSLDELKRKVNALSSLLQPVALATRGIGCGDKRTTFFYVELDNQVAAPLFAQSTRALPDSHSPEIGAHLSLMYADPNASIDRNALAHELVNHLPKQIGFDELELVTPVGRETTKRWQMRHAVRLVPADS